MFPHDTPTVRSQPSKLVGLCFSFSGPWILQLRPKLFEATSNHGHELWGHALFGKESQVLKPYLSRLALGDS